MFTWLRSCFTQGNTFDLLIDGAVVAPMFANMMMDSAMNDLLIERKCRSAKAPRG